MRYNSADALDLQGATYDQLKTRFRELAQVVDLLSGERKALADEMRRREIEASVNARLGSLSRDGKRAAKAIVSDEGFVR